MLFLAKKTYLSRMSDGDSIIQHIHPFNIIINQLLSIDIEIIEKEKCRSLLCSFLGSWDNLVMAIRSNNTTLNINEMVASILFDVMR